MARPGGKFSRVEVRRARSPQPPPIIHTTLQTRPHVLETILDYLPRHDAYNLGRSSRRLHGIIASLAHDRQAYGTRDRNDPVPDPYFQQVVQDFAKGDCTEIRRCNEPTNRVCRTTFYNPTARLRLCEGLPDFLPPKPDPDPYDDPNDTSTHYKHNPGLICEYDNMANQTAFDEDLLDTVTQNHMGMCGECRDQELRRIHSMLIILTRSVL